ncbi:MAG: Ig-like domain-containing protein, partial [Nitrospiraceae bacterium]
GNVSSAFGTPPTVAVDASAPTVLSTVPTDGTTDVILNSAITINWSENINCSTVNTTSVTISPPAALALTLCSGSQAVFTPDGQTGATGYTVNADTTITDTAGNPMSAVFSFSYTTANSDLIQPVSAVNTPSDGSVFNSTTSDPYIISGTASDNLAVSGIEVSTNGGANWFPAACAGCPGTNVTWTYSWALPADGTYTIMSRATDASSNIETPVPGNQVIIDRTAPVHLWTAPPANSFYADGASINVSAFITETGVGIADGANCNATIDGSGSGFTGLISYSTGTQICSGVLTINTGSGFLDGQHNLNLRVIDLAGNNAISADRFINIDNAGPSSSVSDPSDGASFNNSTPDPYTISGTATDNITVTAVEVSTDGGNNWGPALCSNCPGSNVNWTFSWPLPIDGTYVVMSRATDSLNNTEVPVAGNTVTIERSALTILNTVPNDLSTNVNPNSPITIIWSEDVDCSTVNTTNIYIDSGSLALSSCSANQAIFNSSGQTFETTYLVTVTAGVRDLAGNPMISPMGFSFETSSVDLPSLSFMSFPYDNGLDPDTGNTTTEFTFKVIYIDNQDDPPAVNYPMIFIGDNDSYYGYPMIEDDPLDTVYSDGKVYTYTTGFGPAEDIRYFFEAQAATGDTSTVNLPTVSPGYKSGPDVYLLPGYNIVGVPKDLSLSNMTYLSLLGDDSGYQYCISWNSLGPDHPVNGIQGEWSDSTYRNLSGGRGYFIYSDGGPRKLDEPAGMGNDVRASVDIPVNGGWSIISNPYSEFIKLKDVIIVRGGTEYTYSQAVANGWVSNAIYEYEGNGPGYAFKAFNGIPEATLDPWMGYYIYITDTVATTLRIYAQ